jgi:hypothetical protein
MERNNTTTFDIICDSKLMIEQAIAIYNKTYQTDFKLSSYREDEVNFASVSYTKATLGDVYALGAMYGRMSVNGA